MKRLVLCFLFVGCGGDAGGSHGSIEVDNLGMELGIVSCGKLFECCTDAEIMEQYMGITHDGQPIDTEEQCVSFTNALLTTFAVAYYKESIAMGRIEYDGAAAADCVAAIESLTCTQLAAGSISNPSTGCRPFIIPKVADGGGCTQDSECTSGNCEGESVPLGEPSTDGVCKPMPMEGQSCDDTCADGMYCGTDQSSGTDACHATRADGSQCNTKYQCASDYCDTSAGMCAQEPVTCDGR